MRFRETGFRPLYHSVCAFELNDKLRTIAKDCPDAAKASHAVVYGYIDQKKGLMLELLGVGKQAPKNFLFKDAYQGKKVAFPASDVLDVEFTPFPELGARTLKQYESHIAKLKKYDASEELEKSREFAFLDGCRDLQHPDNVMVLLVKEGLDTEKVMVRLIGPGDHVLIGTLLSQPSQGYGVNKGDTVNFNVQENEDKEIFCYLNLNSYTLTKADLEDGSALKKAVSAFLQNKNDHNLKIVFAILRSSIVSLPCRVMLTDEAEKIIEKYNGSDGGPTPEELDVISAGMSFDPHTLKIDGKLFLPVFSSNEEMKGHDEGVDVARVQFLHAVQLAAEGKEDIQGIILNAFTEPFVVDRELFKHIAKMKPLFDEDKETEEPEQPEQPQSVDNQPPHRDVAGIEISVGKMDVFNYALYQNNVPPVRGIVIQNRTGNPVDGLSLRITSEFPFFKEFEAVLPTIPSGKPISLPDPHLIISGSTLADLTEAVNTTVTVELRMDGKTVDVCRGQMQVFAYDQWQGDDSYRDLLPAFVLPNHPAIPALIHDAADYLKKWGKSPSLEGYQMGNPNRVRELAAAAYAAIQKKNIVYAEPPASFSIPGQRIRTPETIMEQRLGTCMDMTLLYAACLEAMGLHPLLVLIEGHIFAGLWLRKRTPEEMHSANLTIDNIDELTKRFNNGSDEMTFVECTAMCSDNKDSFETAEKIAKFDRLSNPSKFEMAIDVKVARRTGIKPITSRVRNGGSYQIEVEEKPEDEMTSAPAALDISIVEAAPAKTRKVMTKRELWESKLLDLSQNNMLLNLPLNASVLPIMSSHIDELEDALADGHEFHLLPAAEWITDLAFVRRDENGKESKPIQWLPHIIKEMGIFEITDWPVSPDFDYNEKFRQEYRNHRLYTFCGQKELDQSLTNIYRAARSAQQENGVSSLYLAIGLLRWISEESQEPCYAPLILLPIEIIRKSANQGYALHARDEDPHFNTTLLEMLKQNYNIQIQGLDPLPSDEHGIDIRKTFALVRGAVYSVSSWDVIETCVVGNFSFAQFAMWNDIHTAGDCLENSKVVRSLMKGRMDWKIDETENLEDEHTYLPITLDATQLKAVKMAAHGNTFVLHGPPGTGKSQTITAMIANLIAQGKTVLFVAEKMAALSVVEKRLSSLGIGDFCLELHSEKANKKHVLTQLDKALSIKHPSVQSEYEEALKKAQESRSRLDGYAEHLHAVQRCGYSMRELIDLYETVRDSDDMIPFETDQVRELTREELEKHVPLIGQLTAAGESVDTLLDSPLLSVGLTSYSAEVRSSLRPSVEGYIGALRSAQDAGAAMAELFGIPAPRSRADFMRLASIAGLYRDSLGMAPLFADLLAVGCDDAYRYFDRQKMLRDEEEDLLKIWKFDSLGMDVAEYYSRHEAAGKKLLGRASAIAAVTGGASEMCRY